MKSSPPMCPTKSTEVSPATAADASRMAAPSPRITSSAIAKPNVSAKRRVSSTAYAGLRAGVGYSAVVIGVTREGSRLFGQATGQPRFEMFPESETRFFLKVTDAQIDFEQDAAGQVTGLVLHQGGRDMKARRTE